VADPQERLQTALADRYRLERELGQGGMATVYLAQDLRHDRPVAFKVLHPHLAATLGPERFLREIRLAARLQHPHILSVHDSGETAGFLWFTMPYVEGESLRERLAREHQLPLDEALRLTREIALALDFAHRHGVIHRDIKPENILLVDGQALVADFGIGRALDSSEADDRLTQTGMVVGTPAYMSPEQASGERELDGRTDVYSLGIVLYEMLAGEPPFTGRTMQSVMAKRLGGEVPSLRQLRPAAPEWLERVVEKALARLPADRFATPAQLAQALLEAPRDTTVTPVTTAGRSRRRLSVPSWLALLIGILITASMGMLLWQRTRRPGEPSGTKMLAVLPFKNLGAPGDQYFADGLTEEITSRLAGVSKLGIISRTSADQYKTTSKTIKQIGQELGVGYVLEGSVRWEKSPEGLSRVRVTPQLIRVSDDRHLWAERYDAVIAEVFQVQSSIAEQVIGAMGLALEEPQRRLVDERPTTNLEAYDFYLRGKDYYDRGYAREDFRTAIQMYQRAIELDSNYARAYAHLSEVYSALYWFFYDRTNAALERAKTAADRAVKIRPDLPDGHIALGYYYYWGKLDYEAALREFEVARARQPNNGELAFATAAVQRRQGRWKDAIASFSRAAELDPRSGVVRFNLGETYTLLRDHDRALGALDEAIEIIPDWPVPYALKARVVLASGRGVDEAKRVMQEASRALDFAKLAEAMAGISFTSDFVVRPAFLLTADPVYHRELEALSLPAFGDTAGYYMLKADLYRDKRRAEVVPAYLDSARTILEAQVRAQPEEASFHAQLGLTYGYLHHSADAIREGEEAVRLLPVSREAYRGANLLAALALIYTLAGRQSEAIDRLEYLLSIPSTISRALLRVDPRWASLRVNPRFQKLVAGN
jgi:serine/threonine protein kinase/tetratricopeptide (TPR) repeat protein